MKKIPSLFQRNYDGDRLVYDELVPGTEWVANGEGVATEKLDGTACMIRDGKLYKRYDRKKGKSAPEGWEPCEDAPNEHTGHWPGWVPVGDGPEDQWHREAFSNAASRTRNWTYELTGPKVQGNPYNLLDHHLWPHGDMREWGIEPPRTFDALKEWFATHEVEGIVWWRGQDVDCDKVKIKRRDFGLPWPVKP